MQYVLTLTTNPMIYTLSSELTETIEHKLISAGATACVIKWLAPSSAVDISFSSLKKVLAQEIANELLKGLPIDNNIQETTNRRKNLLIADMDSTIIENETLDELGKFVGKTNEMSAITCLAMNGKIDFESSLVDRVSLLEGQTMSNLMQVIRNELKITSGAKTLIRTMRAHGAKTGIVSGGFTPVTEMVKEIIGFDFSFGNNIKLQNNIVTGKLEPPIINGQAKSEILLRQAAKWNISPRNTLAVGDGANDIPMINTAGMGVSFHAKPAVRAIAPFNIEYSDLSALLYLQGYKKAEFVS